MAAADVTLSAEAIARLDAVATPGVDPWAQGAEPFREASRS